MQLLDTMSSEEQKVLRHIAEDHLSSIEPDTMGYHSMVKSIVKKLKDHSNSEKKKKTSKKT